MAERSIIDTIARDIDPRAWAPHAFGTNDTDLSVILQKRRNVSRQHARTALQALLDAGPTEAMVEAGWQESWKRNDSDTSCTPRDLFTAMLRAALEETGNV